MFDRKTRILLRKVFMLLVSTFTLVCFVASLGLGGLFLTIQQTEYIALGILAMGLIFFFINDRRMMLLCFVASTLLAFVAHEKSMGSRPLPRPAQEHILPAPQPDSIQ
jgi:hypothetical protein